MADTRIVLPTLHSGQVRLWNWSWQQSVNPELFGRYGKRRKRVRAGRRWGKTKNIATTTGNWVVKGARVGIFTPQHKQWTEIYDELATILDPIEKNKSKSDGIWRGQPGFGLVDFWAIDDNPLAGRGREYEHVIVDEAAFAKNKGISGGVGLSEIWDKAIEPTLLVPQGDAWVYSTPKGIDPDNFFYICAQQSKFGPFEDFHAPTSSNPYVPPAELERYRKINDPLVFRQEYLAEFVDWSGHAFFSLDKLLDGNGKPHAYPKKCDAVFAVIDTAVKTGKEHDGTAVMFFAISRYSGIPLLILDWDIVQIEGAMLETWLPSVFERLGELAAQCGARMGSIGTFIEDKASGTILIQQASKRGWPVTALDMKLTELGKDERAISVSTYVYQGHVGMSEYAYDKAVVYKGEAKNHAISQITTFRIGDKNNKRADDLADTFTYGIAVALGDPDGY